jgi:DNA-binding IclR family transcriptional regulator
MPAPDDTPPEPKAEARDTVSALERGIAVLHCFTEDRRLLGASDLARLTGIPRPTVTRLAQTLVALGLLQTERDGERFLLGPAVVSLARVFLAGLDVRATARPLMQALAEACGGSVYLAVRDGLEMVLIEACRPRSTLLAARLDVGSRAPIANSALGRAYLSALPPAERDLLMESMRLVKGTDWPALQAGLQMALADAWQHGWSVSCGEFHREINSVSVPLVNANEEVMALNCGGPAFVFTEERLRQDIAPQLRRLAHTLAHDIGGRVPPARDETTTP